MQTTVKILLMSKLSDIQQVCHTKKLSTVDRHLFGFTKFIIAKFPDTNTEIDADEEYKRYLKLLP